MHSQLNIRNFAEAVEPSTSIVRRPILGVQLDVLRVAQAIELMIDFTRFDVPRFVCFINVQTLMECYASADLRVVLSKADLATVDGTPLSWCLRLLGASGAECVDGPSVTPLLLQEAAARGVPVGFYGGKPETLDKLLIKVRQRFPKLVIAYAYSPPFSPTVCVESDAVIQEINESGARFLFVGLGCPKQERWMALHSSRVRCVMLGVGAVFDFLAGEKKMAPKWLQRLGLTWLFRLVQEPRRLWRRNVELGPKFVILFLGQLFAETGRKLFWH